MKKLFVAIAILLSIGAKAQTSDTTSITLKAKHHAFVVAFMGDKGSVDRIKYLSQVATAVDTTLADSVMREQDITVVATEALVANIYLEMGVQQERLTTVYNQEIKDLLMPQILSRPTLLAAIQAIAERNATETEARVQSGFDFIRKLK